MNYKLVEIGIELPDLSHAKISFSEYGALIITETKPKKLFKSSSDGSALPAGCECAIPI
jgi:hypothetical protein